MFGWANSFPMSMGGGPHLTETIHATLRDAVGVGGYVVDQENSIDGLKRISKAKGLAVGFAADVAATFQRWPDSAVDHVPVFEQILGIIPAPGASLSTRRDAIVIAWTKQISGVIPQVRDELQALDPRFDIIAVSWNQDDTTEAGKPFEEFDASDAFGIGKQTNFPMFSTADVYFVLFDLGSGVLPSPAETRLIEQAKRLMNKLIPSWATFQIATEIGFELDIDRLDITALVP